MKTNFFFVCLFCLAIFNACTKDANYLTELQNLEQRAGECTNIPSFKLDEKRDAPGSYSLLIDYSVRACDKSIPINVNMIISNFRTKEIVSDYTDAPLNLKLGWGGLAVGDWYQVQIIVRNASTNDLIESKILSLIIRSKI